MAYIEVWEKDADTAYYWNPIMNERREEKPLKTEISEWILMKSPSNPKEDFFTNRTTKEVSWYLSGIYTPVQPSAWHKKFDLKSKKCYYVDDETGSKSFWALPMGATVVKQKGNTDDEATDESDSDDSHEDDSDAGAVLPSVPPLPGADLPSVPPLPPLPPPPPASSSPSNKSYSKLVLSELKAPTSPTSKRYWRESLSKKSINDFISQAVASCVMNYNMHRKRVQTNVAPTSTEPNTLEEYTHDCHAFGFGVKDHAPGIFSHLREVMGVSMQAYCTSLGNTAVKKTGAGGGRSSANFFFSADQKFLCKTLNKKETAMFLTILKDYYYHMLANNDSLLCRVFGLYTVNPLTKHSASQTIVVMANGLCTDLKIEQTFDLKGSSYNRYVKPDEGTNQVLKDSNLGDLKLKLGPDLKRKLVGQLRRDVWFLQRNGIMDYSLLLGVSEGVRVSPSACVIRDHAATDSTESCWRRFRGGLLSKGPAAGKDGKVNQDHRVYFLTVIDLLQQFTTKKAAERILKTAKAFKKLDLSAIPPDEYATRFLNFMQRFII